VPRPSRSQEEWQEVAAALDLEWLEEVPNSHTPTRVRCLKCGYERAARPNSVQQGKAGCPSCAGQVVTQEEWRSRAAALDLEWLEEVPNNSTLVGIRCLKCGREWKTKGQQVRKGRGCVVCAGQVVSQQERDKRALELNFEWLEEVRGAHTPTPARCLSCGYEWLARASNMRLDVACPDCAGKVVTQEEWRSRAAALDLEWLEEVPNQASACRVRCLKCGSEWKTTGKQVRKGRGCPSCAQQGFDATSPAHLYLVVRENGIAKIGITGVASSRRRLEDLARLGYRQVRVWDFAVGRDARLVELAVLSWWRNELDLPQAVVDREQGATETVDTANISLYEIEKYVRELRTEMLR
jgi:predicted  nucleic acid-binding Zn-ribbon protein